MSEMCKSKQGNSVQLSELAGGARIDLLTAMIGSQKRVLLLAIHEQRLHVLAGVLGGIGE